MAEETLRDGSKIIVTIKAEWPEEDQKKIQEQVNALNASLEKTHDLASKLMEMLNNGPDINLV